jgi:SAM-dependent methyltransferase
MPKIEPFEKHTQEYEDWFEENKYAYKSEINAIRSILPDFKNGIEIGIGSGRFAIPFGITSGVEPSAKMAEIAQDHGIEVIEGVGEDLPIESDSFDMVLMVTTLCFLDDAKKAFSEIYRILKKSGFFINGFVDKDSKIGKTYQKNKDKSVFYRPAVFYSVKEVIKLLDENGFRDYEFRQTIFNTLDGMSRVEEVKDGYGEGSFVVIKARK